MLWDSAEKEWCAAGLEYSLSPPPPPPLLLLLCLPLPDTLQKHFQGFGGGPCFM